MVDPREVLPFIKATIRGEFSAAVEEFRFGSFSAATDLEQLRLVGLLARATWGVAPAHRVGSADEWVAWTEASKLSQLEAMRAFVEGVMTDDTTFSRLASPVQREASVFAAARKDAASLALFRQDFEARDAEGLTPLHHSASAGTVDCATLLLTAGVDPNCLDHHNRAPLHYAAIAGNEQLARLLLDHGANNKMADDAAKLPTHLADENGHQNLALVLSPPLEVRLPGLDLKVAAGS